jgi:hypothetical protein
MNLWERRNDLVGTFSKGMKQKLFMISIGVFGKVLTLSIVAVVVACLIVFLGPASVETELKELSA